MDSDKTEFMRFKQVEAISVLNCKSLKLLDNFAYLDSNSSSTESDINISIQKISTAILRLSILEKSDYSDKVKQKFFQEVIVYVLLYSCTTWILKKGRKKRKMEEKEKKREKKREEKEKWEWVDEQGNVNKR